MVVEYSGGQEGYVKGSKEKGGGNWRVVEKLKSACGKKRQVKHGKGRGVEKRG